jgi:hypothetical protein
VANSCITRHRDLSVELRSIHVFTIYASVACRPPLVSRPDDTPSGLLSADEEDSKSTGEDLLT